MLHLNLEKFKNLSFVNKLIHNRPVTKFLITFKNRPRMYVNKDFVTFWYLVFSILVIIFTFGYISFYYNSLPSQIPLWYSLTWGAYRLSVKQYIYFIPATTLFLYVISLFFCFQYLKNNIKEVARFVSTVTFGCVLFLCFSAIFIVNSSVGVVYVFGDYFWWYFMPFLTSLGFSYISAKLVIRYAHKLKIIEYPTLRNEPQKVLMTPTPRGGAIAFFIGFAVSSMIFLYTSQKAWGLILGTLITTITGYLDDRYKLSYLPRLVILLPLAFTVVVLSGFVTFYLPNPFGDAVKLDSFRIFIDFLAKERSIVVYGAIFSFLWFMWMTNMMSWNNGIDGQFVAISSVAVIAIAILSFRYGVVSYEQQLSAQLSFIALGAILGLFVYTFPPQRIVWGFGATSVGLVIAALSILSGTRVASATIVLLIPAIDTFYVLLNRLRQHKSPFLGDSNHLHHKLLQLGWSRKRIAFSYWIVSILFLFISLITSEKAQVLTYISLVGVALYIIVMVRYYATRRAKIS